MASKDFVTELWMLNKTKWKMSNCNEVKELSFPILLAKLWVLRHRGFILALS
jgi:hypothetical protein